MQREKEAREAGKRAEKLLEGLREEALWPLGMTAKYWQGRHEELFGKKLETGGAAYKKVQQAVEAAKL